jgi:hypothetical protein
VAGNARVVRRVLWIAMPEVIVHGAQICALVGQVVAATVAQHVRPDPAKLRRLAGDPDDVVHGLAGELRLHANCEELDVPRASRSESSIPGQDEPSLLMHQRTASRCSFPEGLGESHDRRGEQSAKLGGTSLGLGRTFVLSQYVLGRDQAHHLWW